MAGIQMSQNGFSLITNSPNFLGILYDSNIRKTQFLSAIGGIGGSNTMIAKNPEFPTGVQYALDDPFQPAITENQSLGLANPTRYILSQHKNVVQIFQSDTGVSRLRERSNRLEGINNVSGRPETSSEIARQIEFHIKDFARQMNYTALNGIYSDAGLTNPDQALKTRGIINCIETNVYDGLDMTSDDEGIRNAMDEMFRMVFDRGMWGTPTVIVNSLNKVKLTNAYGSLALCEVPLDRFVAGINLQMIVTNFANTGVYVIIDNDVPNDTVLLADMDFVRPVFTRDKETNEIILVHPLSQRGGNLFEIYAEFGLDHGPETYHGKIINFGLTS